MLCAGRGVNNNSIAVGVDDVDVFALTVEDCEFVFAASEDDVCVADFVAVKRGGEFD